jgi:hypothetical protein
MHPKHHNLFSLSTAGPASLPCAHVQRAVEEGPLDEKAHQHIAECPACTEFSDWHQQVASSLRHLPLVPVPQDFTQRVMSALPSVRAQRGIPGVARQWILGAGLLLVMGLGGYGLLGPHPGPAPWQVGQTNPDTVPEGTTSANRLAAGVSSPEDASELVVWQDDPTDHLADIVGF